MSVACLSTLSALAQEHPDPAKAESKESPDSLHGAIDPFALGLQRRAFLRAAGVDSELDQAEFDSDQTKGDGFSRSFDTWEAIWLFDTNHNATIDWLEASGYRLRMREVFLARHDKNKSKSLEKDEREALLKELEGLNLARMLLGERRGGSPPSDEKAKVLGHGGVVMEGVDPNADLEQLRQAYDKQARAVIENEVQPWVSDDDNIRQMAERGLFITEDRDGDGVQTIQDWEILRMRLRQKRRKDCERNMVKALEKYDSNRNGSLDPEESAKINEERIRGPQMSFDRNFDGVFDDSERRMYEASYWYVIEKDFEEFDENGDGVFSDPENEAKYRAGQITIELKDATPDELNRIYGLYRSEHWHMFDADGDEVLDEKELEKLNSAFTRESRGRAPIIAYTNDP